MPRPTALRLLQAPSRPLTPEEDAIGDEDDDDVDDTLPGDLWFRVRRRAGNRGRTGVGVYFSAG